MTPPRGGVTVPSVPVAVLRRRGRLGLRHALPHLRRHVHGGERPHHVLLQAEPPLDLLHHAGAAVPHDHRVDAVAPLADLVGEPPLAPLLHLDDLRAHVLQPPGHAVGHLLGLHLVVARLEDVDRLVLGHVSLSSWRTRSGSTLRLNRFMAPRAPSLSHLSTASAARRTASSSTGISSGANSSSTCSLSSAELSEAPTPIRSRE